MINRSFNSEPNPGGLQYFQAAYILLKWLQRIIRVEESKAMREIWFIKAKL